MTSRRMFLTGSSAAVAAAGLGGIAAFSTTRAVAQQQGAGGPVAAEVVRQLRNGIGKMKAGKGAGAVQAAALLRVYAATQSDANLRAVIREAIRQKGRNAIIYGEINHAEMMRFADDLGVPRSWLPPHTAPDPFLREQALDLLLKEGVTPSIQRAADTLDDMADVIDSRRARVRTVMMQIPPYNGNPGNCDSICGAADNAKQLMEGVCAAAAVAAMIPGAGQVAATACAAAAATWLSLMAGCSACQVAISVF